ncbi:MAG: NapC/NirT family cytochrome c [Bacteroidales bacterium]|nr:NapC/NirT family cytochrome c [Bacteroidales bacterium]
MKKLPKSFYSWPTAIGAVLAAVSLFIIVFLMLISALFPTQVSQYLGLFTYIIMPAFLVVGLLLIPIGAWRKFRKDKKDPEHAVTKFPKVDLNDPSQRMVVFIFTLGTAIFILFTALGSYSAFHITESNKFCGMLCHNVMAPEYTTHQNSPHARVNCVECHVGSGATWYVKSKLSGLRQVYAELTHSWPTPIATPVESLRPARETCEECHWPQKFYNREIINKKYYLADQTTSEFDLTLLMKTGPDLQAKGLRSGIHWHVNPEVKIEYVSANEKRDTIAEVIYTNLKTGKVTVYKDTANVYTEKQIDKFEHRTMDCIDCHNRPSHDFKSPSAFFNEAMNQGKIPRELPDVKTEAMTILYDNTFPTVDSADRFIKVKFLKYYKDNYPQVYDTAKTLIDQTIKVLQDGYKANIFPSMKASWLAHPNYIGHLETIGCFRCHNGSFESNTGRTISRRCDLCHNITAEGTPGHMEYANGKESLEFKHPVDVGGAWKTQNCVDCHKNLY